MTGTGMSAASATEAAATARGNENGSAIGESSHVTAENATRGATYAPADRNFGDSPAPQATEGEADDGTEKSTPSESTQAVDTPPVGTDDAGEGESKADGGEVDYEALMRRDLATLKATFPELAGLNDIADMRGALRYAALRDLGLTAEEAYMAASAPRVRRDNRAHLSTPVTKGASTAMVGMSASELHTARELFGGMTDADIYNLYKRVSR